MPSPDHAVAGAAATQCYPATPYLHRLTPADGWRGGLVRDEHGNPLVVVAVRIVPTEPVVWRRVGPGLAAEPPDGSGAVWRRDGRCVDVLAELLELPTT